MTVHSPKPSSTRRRRAILVAQALSYLLMITFLFADARFRLVGVFAGPNVTSNSETAYIAACLVGILGSISLWLTWYYTTKANSIRDMLVICAWTHRVKSGEKWVSLEEFFTDQLGYAVSHGLSEARLFEMRRQIDSEWKTIKIQDPKAAGKTEN